MLFKSEFVSSETFLKEFNKRFKNFINKSPLILSYTVNPFSCTLKDENTLKVYTFNFDYSLDVKQNIKKIKDILLENAYPIFTKVIRTKINYTPQELNQIIEERNISLEDALLLEEYKEERINYRVEKVFLLTDKLIIRTLNDNILGFYKMQNMPLSKFMNGIRSKWTKEYSYEIFNKHCVLLNNIDEIIEE